MTVIVYRDGILAADSGGFTAGTKHGHAVKIARGPDGTLYGMAGSSSEASAYLAWVRGGYQGDAPEIRRTDPKESDSAFMFIRARSGASPEVVTAYGVEPREGAPYVVIGAASEFAYGALHAGATAVQAVEAAIAHSQWAHGPVRSISHGDTV